mgnify:CR=1 FL=1
MDNLPPVKNCMVKHAARFGVVKATVIRDDGVCMVTVTWNPTGEVSTVRKSDLSSGYKRGQEVEFVPSSTTGRSLGAGTVISSRILAGRAQVMVDFPTTGEQHWLPYERLRWIKGPKHRFVTGKLAPEDSPERFRLKFLAHAIENWNENTGAFSNLDIDPLPHQVNLVHHILNHGNLNWLIADDVGLGKTIEAGMLIKALEHRGMADRILLVTPAGLTQQWKEEMFSKFGMEKFRIYGNNFTIDESREWGMYPHVIASIDKLKEENTLASIMQAENWDIVIFDEAHRLSKTQYGQSFEVSQRYHLAESLRSKSRALILLSATPHQGKSDKFSALLKLLRPEMSNEIETLSVNPEILKDMMFRNNKADVTDEKGNFIFKGKITKAVKVELDDKTKGFDDNLREYLRQGYEEAAALGRQGVAIGFVMTVYRKLAASSTYAIYTALQRRLERLKGEFATGIGIEYSPDPDSRFEGEYEEFIDSEAHEFFTGEIDLLNELILQARDLVKDDKKLERFVDSLLTDILSKNPSEKVLIFTEYRSTQEHIQKALIERFDDTKVDLINGSMKQSDRRDAIEHFEQDGQFLISTEAGGEGINLQSHCHIMVNFDLPWNPMRIVQRIGRLYRYGQDKPVVVFNMFSPSTADEQIIDLMYQRINQVVSDLSIIGDEFNDRLSDDILGEIAELVDVAEILKESTGSSIERTKERINTAMDLAKKAAGKQRELFEFARSYDPTALTKEFIPTKEHISSFVEGMFEHFGVEVLEKTNNGLVWDVRIPELVLKRLGSQKSRRKLTLDKAVARNRKDVDLLGMDNSLMRLLLDEAQSRGFGGIVANISSDLAPVGAIAAGYVRWQNDEGRRQSQELTAWHVTQEGSVTVSPSWLPEFFEKPLEKSDKGLGEKSQRANTFEKLTAAAEEKLTSKSNRYLHPENFEFLSTANLNDQSTS